MVAEPDNNQQDNPFSTCKTRFLPSWWAPETIVWRRPCRLWYDFPMSEQKSKYRGIWMLIFLICLTVSALAGMPGAPPGLVTDRDVVAAADVIVVGTVKEVREQLFHNEKKLTKEEVRQLQLAARKASENAPRIDIEYTVLLNVTKHLKGAVRNPEVVLQWRDLHDSMCPHIAPGLFRPGKSGIWHTGPHVVNGPHDHAVYFWGTDPKLIARIETLVDRIPREDLQAERKALALQAEAIFKERIEAIKKILAEEKAASPIDAEQVQRIESCLAIEEIELKNMEKEHRKAGYR